MYGKSFNDVKASASATEFVVPNYVCRVFIYLAGCTMFPHLPAPI